MIRLYGGFASSRLGPTFPLVPASDSVWQPPHPCSAKIILPAAGSPLTSPPAVPVLASVPVVPVVSVVPCTVSGVGVVSLPPPQPATASARTPRTRTPTARRRIARHSIPVTSGPKRTSAVGGGPAQRGAEEGVGPLGEREHEARCPRGDEPGHPVCGRLE